MINLKFLVLCKVTAKQSIGGKIAKGMSVQVVEKILSSTYKCNFLGADNKQ